MNRKALVVIDIQNDITKHYRDIIDRLNGKTGDSLERTFQQREVLIGAASAGADPGKAARAL